MNVTLELDSGPFEMSFAYIPMGEPAFSDVPGIGAACGTYEEAERTGALMLSIGNWRSFRIEKRYGQPELIDGPGGDDA